MDIRSVIRIPDYQVDASNGSEDRRRNEKKEDKKQQDAAPEQKNDSSSESQNNPSTTTEIPSEDRQIIDTLSWLELRTDQPHMQQSAEEVNNHVRQFRVFQKK